MSKLSWDAYIDGLIYRTRDGSGISYIDKACIIGIDRGIKWTTDSHSNALQLSQNEARNIAKCFESKNFSQFIESGVVAEGFKYVFFKREEDEIMYAVNRGHGRLTLQSSKTAIVIAHTPETFTWITNTAVNDVARHLESMNM